MKAKELMIGDWVTGKKWRENPFKLSRINDNGKYYYGITSDGTRVGPFLLEEIEPIPLTAEILEKNGFVENRGVTSWKFETDREDLIDIYGVKDYHLSINIEDTHGSGKGYRWMLNNLTIFYVHQLQHALRLCGIKKTIEL